MAAAAPPRAGPPLADLEDAPSGAAKGKAAASPPPSDAAAPAFTSAEVDEV